MQPRRRSDHRYTEDDFRAATTMKAVKFTAFAVVVLILLLILFDKGGLLLDVIGILLGG